jgi:hypothetical protein
MNDNQTARLGDTSQSASLKQQREAKTMKKTLHLQTATLVMVAACAYAIDPGWTTIDNWQYKPAYMSYATKAVQGSDGTILVGGHAENGLGAVAIVKGYNKDGEGSLLFAQQGDLTGGIAAGADQDVYLNCRFQNPAGVWQWTLAHAWWNTDAKGMPALQDWRSVWSSSEPSSSSAQCIAYFKPAGENGQVFIAGKEDSTYYTLRILEEQAGGLTEVASHLLKTLAAELIIPRTLIVNADGIFLAGTVGDPADWRVMRWLVAYSSDQGANWQIIDLDPPGTPIVAYSLVLDGAGNIFTCGGDGSWNVRLYTRQADGSYLKSGNLDPFSLRTGQPGYSRDIGIAGGALYVAGFAREVVSPTRKGGQSVSYNVWVVRKGTFSKGQWTWSTDDYLKQDAPYGYSNALGWLTTAASAYVVGVDCYRDYPKSKAATGHWIVRKKALTP